ncbi:unnamed protein product [Adineta steineri]|uniref:Uncharacterized protein n=2 Tax=Adineta steineri TaxID=433720 RepID=A0A818NKQ5_9BILA|nr:unnamed protein product [Adineta steineri]CAF3605358.1 unnamed protein product [Adineta steineri]
MTNDGLRQLPPPPLFTIRPPPKPPGSIFEHFQTVEILNGQCVIPTLNILQNSTSISREKHIQQINWLNLFLLILALISVISCIIIAIFIFICLRKLKNEEKQYKNYVLSGSLSRNPHQSDLCTRTNEHYKCTSNKLNCCDDYYSHQLIPLSEAPPSSVISPHHIKNSNHNIDSQSIVNNVGGGGIDNSQNHQYEYIPEYLLTMTRRHHHPPIVCHHHQQQQHPLYHRPNTCSLPYATFSRSLILSQGTTATNTSDSSQCTCSSPPSAAATVVQEESSVPLLAPSIQKQETLISSPKSMRIGWTKRNTSSISTKRKSTGANIKEQRYSFLSQLRKSSVLQ